MATYKYTAISKDGVKVSGVVEGFNEFDAVDRIKQDCDIVLKLTEVEEKKPGLLSMEIGGNRLNAKAFSLMCAQFSIILQSGIPIGRTVRLIGDKMTDKKLALMHNVAGEIKGSEAAMQYAVDHNIPEITIYHDYEGIAKWCTGAWKATKPGTIAYQAFYREAVKKVKVHFVKVKGHSNDKYNDMADQLAKKALGIL